MYHIPVLFNKVVKLKQFSSIHFVTIQKQDLSVFESVLLEKREVMGSILKELTGKWYTDSLLYENKQAET